MDSSLFELVLALVDSALVAGIVQQQLWGQPRFLIVAISACWENSCPRCKQKSSSFPPSRRKTERLSEKTPDPVFIVILGCEKHAKLLICVYLSVLCDIMLRALLSSLVNSIPLHNALFHAQPDKVWEES